MLDELEANGTADGVFSDEQTAAERAALQAWPTICTERTDRAMSEGGRP